MGSLIERTDAWISASGFAVMMSAAWGFGWRNGRSRAAEAGQDPGVRFTDASMALLGLLLGFTFSTSLGKHDQRRGMVVTDSNAIGDFYTCATLLDAPNRAALQAVIREYAADRLAASESASEEEVERAIGRAIGKHTRMTEIVRDALSRGTPIAVPLTNTLNAVTSSHAARLAAYRDRLPGSILFLLFLCAVLPAYLVGQQQGASQKLHVAGTFTFILLVSMVIFVTLDLNQPGRGTITVTQDTLRRLVESISN